MNTIYKSLFILLLSVCIGPSTFAFDALNGAPTTRLGKVFAQTGDGISFAGENIGSALNTGWTKTRSFAENTNQKLNAVWDATYQKGAGLYQDTQRMAQDTRSWASKNKPGATLLAIGGTMIVVGIYNFIEWINA